jgi:hypothetical protein
MASLNKDAAVADQHQASRMQLWQLWQLISIKDAAVAAVAEQGCSCG